MKDKLVADSTGGSSGGGDGSAAAMTGKEEVKGAETVVEVREEVGKAAAERVAAVARAVEAAVEKAAAARAVEVKAK